MRSIRVETLHGDLIGCSASALLLLVQGHRFLGRGVLAQGGEEVA